MARIMEPTASEPASTPASALADRSADSISGELRAHWKTMLWIVIGMFITILPGAAFSVFIAPLSEEFGWSVKAITLWSLIWSVGTILAAPFVGALADRVGARRVIFVSLVALGVVWALLHARMQSLPVFYLSGFLLGVFISGSSSVTYGRIASRLFRAGLGTSLGFMSCGTGLATVFGPSLMQFIIANHGWRSAYLFAGVLMFVILVPMMLWLDRDEKAPPPLMVQDDEGRAVAGVSLQEAMRMPVFWVIAAGTILYGVAAGGVNVNIVPFLTSQGMSAAAAAGLIGVYGFSTLVGRFGTGIVIDRWRLNPARLMGLVILVQGIAFIAMPLTSGATQVATLLLYGLTVGAEADCIAYCVARIFGQRFFGRIFGTVGFTMLYVGLGVGPFLFASAHDLWNSYTLVYFCWAAIAFAAVPLFLWAARTPLLLLPQAKAQ